MLAVEGERKMAEGGPPTPSWTQTWGPPLVSAGIGAATVLIGIVLTFGQSSSAEQARQMVKVTEFMAMATLKMDELCKRETLNRENDEKYRAEVTSEITLIKQDMARVKQVLKLE